MDINKKEVFIPCSCMSEVVLLTRFEGEEEVYLTVYKYFSVSYSFWARFKMCWGVLNGRGISTADVILSKENFDKVKSF